MSRLFGLFYQHVPLLLCSSKYQSPNPPLHPFPLRFSPRPLSWLQSLSGDSHNYISSLGYSYERLTHMLHDHSVSLLRYYIDTPNLTIPSRVYHLCLSHLTLKPFFTTGRASSCFQLPQLESWTFILTTPLLSFSKFSSLYLSDFSYHMIIDSSHHCISWGKSMLVSSPSWTP